MNHPFSWERFISHLFVVMTGGWFMIGIFGGFQSMGVPPVIIHFCRIFPEINHPYFWGLWHCRNHITRFRTTDDWSPGLEDEIPRTTVRWSVKRVAYRKATQSRGKPMGVLRKWSTNDGQTPHVPHLCHFRWENQWEESRNDQPCVSPLTRMISIPSIPVGSGQLHPHFFLLIPIMCSPIWRFHKWEYPTMDSLLQGTSYYLNWMMTGGTPHGLDTSCISSVYPYLSGSIWE